MKIGKRVFMRKLLAAFLVMSMFCILMSCKTVEPLDPDLAISIEINNIPDGNIGWSGLAGVGLVEKQGTTEDPQLGIKVNSNVYSGLLTYKNGTEFKIKDVRRNLRYMVIFVMVQEGQTTVTRFSKQFTINSGTIRLDFNNDLYSDPKDALTHYL
jgi:hypothetical protein